MHRLPIVVMPLDAASVAPYGWMLGKGLPAGDGVPSYSNPRTDFWQEHVFDTAGGEPEVLWVNYRDANPDIDTLEMHRVTQQAIVPLTGDIIQVVAMDAGDGTPDLGSLRAFRIAPGEGICMRPGCWHATRVAAGESRCLMLTRRSTTVDLIGHLAGGHPMTESVLAPLRARLG
jgi:ureidoglycolate lyase